MLKVRIELVPDGDQESTRTLAELEIANDGTGTEFTGNYNVVLREFSGGSAVPYVDETQAVIHDVERDLMRPTQLVAIALSILAPVKRTMAAFPPPPWGKIVRRPR